MKKRTKIILSIVLVLVVSIGAVTVWQWNNIEAVLMRVKYSPENLKEQVTEQNEIIAEDIKKLPGNFRTLTSEQEDALKEGELTEQEAIKIMTGNSESKEQGEVVQGTVKPAVAPTPDSSPSPKPVEDKEKQITELVAQIYLLRISFSSKLDSLMASAKAEYSAVQEGDQAKTQQTIFLKYVKKATALEGECDTAVNKILSQLEPLLRETKGDVSLVDDIRKAYYKEKSIRKAYYMSLYA
jgi:hypothetical protein